MDNHYWVTLMYMSGFLTQEYCDIWKTPMNWQKLFVCLFNRGEKSERKKLENNKVRKANERIYLKDTWFSVLFT